MTVGVLFGVGIFFIAWGLFVLRPGNRMKKEAEYAENIAQNMIGQLEQTARIILSEIDNRAEENKRILEEGTVLLQKIKRAKDENFSSISNNHLMEKQREIQRLLEEGHDTSEIAKAMDMGKGELQLILDLNRGGNING